MTGIRNAYKGSAIHATVDGAPFWLLLTFRTPIEHPLVVTSLASTVMRDDDDVTNTIGGTEYTRPKETSQFFVACGCSVAIATDIDPWEAEATLLISGDTECYEAKWPTTFVTAM